MPTAETTHHVMTPGIAESDPHVEPSVASRAPKPTHLSARHTAPVCTTGAAVPVGAKTDPHVGTVNESPAAKTTYLSARHTAAVRATKVVTPEKFHRVATAPTQTSPDAANSTYQLAVMRAESKQALRQLQFTSAESSRYVEAALASQPKPTTLEQLIRVALQCSRATGRCSR